jgi:cytidylate kinase
MVFMIATPAVRAGRRAVEMGAPERYHEYLAEIERRDAADSEREVAPLRQADGALVLDTGDLEVDECVAAIVARLRDIGTDA